ncbi:MAG: replication restart helicase PriA [Burkholderiaceae bacterium]
MSQFPTDLSTGLSSAPGPEGSAGPPNSLSLPSLPRPQAPRWYTVALATPRLSPLTYGADNGPTPAQEEQPQASPSATLAPGDWCIAPLGKRALLGLILSVSDTPPENLSPDQIRPVSPIRPQLPALSERTRSFYAFTATYYRRPLGAVLATAIPPYLQRPVGYAPKSPKPRYPPATDLPSGAEPYRGPRPRLVIAPLTEEQAAALEAITAQLTQALTNRPSSPLLLHGVTGSGKTRVYVEAMRALWQSDPDAQVLLMVPEIGLTPQLENRMREAFPEKTQVSLHSGMPEKGRAISWLMAAQGIAHLAIGTRLSVLTPLPRLRLVIVDEEHDAALKQQDGLRYSARDLAVYRARQENALVILGSATPSLESLARCDDGAYQRLVLTRQATGAQRPPIRLIDTLVTPATDGLTEPARVAIAQVLASGGQALVFLNRRGWAPVLGCESCGWVQHCGACLTPMVLHRVSRRWRLICHHCGIQTPAPQACPDCGAQDVGPIGRGIQKLEDTLQRAFPTASILRLDRDAIRSVKDMQAAMRAISEGRVQIIVGTQMMAKGHDLPGLRLVVVADADQQLLHPDFRAPEWLLATLTQVAGRAGRHTTASDAQGTQSPPAEVLIQTRYPQHPLFRALVDNTTEGFVRRLLEERRAAGLPPFGHMAIVRLADRDEDRLRSWAVDLHRRLYAWLRDQRQQPNVDPQWADAQVYPPAPDYPERRAGRARWHLVVEGPTRKTRAQIVSQVEEFYASLRTTVDLVIEIDPLSQS